MFCTDAFGCAGSCNHAWATLMNSRLRTIRRIASLGGVLLLFTLGVGLLVWSRAERRNLGRFIVTPLASMPIDLAQTGPVTLPVTVGTPQHFTPYVMIRMPKAQASVLPVQTRIELTTLNAQGQVVGGSDVCEWLVPSTWLHDYTDDDLEYATLGLLQSRQAWNFQVVADRLSATPDMAGMETDLVVLPGWCGCEYVGAYFAKGGGVLLLGAAGVSACVLAYRVWKGRRRLPLAMPA